MIVFKEKNQDRYAQIYEHKNPYRIKDWFWARFQHIGAH